MKKYWTKIFLKTIQTSLILGLLSLGTYLFSNNYDYFTSFKPYYIQAYRYVYQYKAEEILKKKPTLGRSLATSVAKTNEAAKSIPVITYHGIISGQEDGSNVSLNQFANQMLSLKKAGWQTLGIDDYYEAIYNGKTVPPKSFLLTFDDGRKDAYYPADPILKALSYKAVMFIITDQIGTSDSQYYLNKEEMRKMEKSGRWQIQVHTKSGHALAKVDRLNSGHYYPNKLWLEALSRLETDAEYLDRIRFDLKEAKTDIKDLTGKEPLAIAIPYGDLGESRSNYGDATIILRKELAAYYPLSFLQYNSGRGQSSNYIGSKSSFHNRIEVGIDWSGYDLVSVLNASVAKKLPYDDDFAINNGWINPWGNKYFDQNGLTLRMTSSLKGSSVFLDGSGDWSSYALIYRAALSKDATLKQVNWLSANTASVSCSYHNSGLIIEYYDGEKLRLLKKMTSPLKLDGWHTFETRLGKADISCLVDGKKMAKSKLPLKPVAPSGGIGFNLSGKTQNDYLEIRHLNVQKYE